MNSNNRREFLRKSFLGISGAALMPSALKSDIYTSGVHSALTDLPSRMLGKTGIRTPLISMGTSGVTSPGFVRAAYEAGIKIFFSATYYGEGNNEILVGDALKTLPRDSFIVGTASTPNGLDTRSGLLTGDFNAKDYLKKADESLRRFGLDHIDILLFPYASRKETILNEGILRTMEEVKKQGKVRFTGIASHGGMIEALDAAAGSGVYDLAMISYNFRIQDIESLNTSVANATSKGIGVIAMKTTAGAARDKSFNISAALKWVLQNQNLATIVSGMTSLDELQKNLAMIQNLKMSEQEINDLKIASAASETGLYCQQCRECLVQCPHNLDIPAIMRSYMYTYGYRNIEQAWYTLADAGLSGNICDNCSICSVKCTSGFNVKKKIADISRLTDVPKEFLLT